MANNTIIEVEYATYRPFRILPIIKCKKFKNKSKAQAFIEKIKLLERKFIWNIYKDGIEVESL